MPDWLGFSKCKMFRQRTLQELKELARILIIDDKKIDLIKDIEQEGWRVKYLKDLDKFDNTDLIDSHIICIDILGVGQKLRCTGEGLGLVKAIKNEYPQKRILLYSSMPTHHIFDESLDLVDKRILKDGQPYPFVKAIEELAQKSFDWNSCISDVYFKFRPEFGIELSLEDFNKKMKKCISSSGDVDINKIIKYTSIGLSVAKCIKTMIEIF